MTKDVTKDESAALDVLVIGAGIAGTSAALAAAEAGARVGLASAGATFSGSSFFAGTWGLGLVGPDGAGDVDDLVSSICKVGRGMADPDLARVLAEGTEPAIRRLEALGCTLRCAHNAGERDFIPCFDRKHRSWHGLGRDSYRASVGRALAAAGVRALPHLELLDLLGASGSAGEKDAPPVGGAVFFDREAGGFRAVRAGAVVLATGGFGGLFERTLTMPDVLGTAQAMALSHGAALVNAEFIQIMPGLVTPVEGVVFNERTFRYARVEGFSRRDAAELLDARAGHGPFTASMPDAAVDLAIVAAGPEGARVSYELPGQLPEFMQTYFDWFARSFGRSPADGVRIAPYAHAANGGIRIDAQAATDVDGLFACGECTGGMHGADRIGGLSSANGLVFGHIAGTSAARWAASHADGAAGVDTGEPLPHRASAEADAVMAELRHLMSTHCLVVRTEAGLEACLASMRALERRLDRSEVPCEDAADVAKTLRVRHALLSCRALAHAMRERKESRGAHFRADHPHEDPAQATPRVITLEDLAW